MKRLFPICFLFCLLALTASAFQPNENNPCCCTKIQQLDTPQTQCLTEADLIGGNWVEQFDVDVASSHRILAFNKSGLMDINTIFEDGYVENEVGSWTLSHHQGRNFLTIDDPVIGEAITYEVKATDKGIQLKELGIDEVLEFTYQPKVEMASF